MNGHEFLLKNGLIFVLAEAAGGLYSSSQLKALCDLSEEESAFLKITEDQRVGFMISTQRLNEVQNKCAKIGLLLRHYRATTHFSPKACLGELCLRCKQDALGDSIELSEKIGAKIKALGKTLSIGMNGCATACVGSATDDIHLVGHADGYKIVLGGKSTEPAGLGIVLDPSVPKENLGDVIEHVIKVFAQEKQENEHIADVIKRIGIEPFRIGSNKASSVVEEGLLDEGTSTASLPVDELLSDEPSVAAAPSDELLSDESAVTTASSDELLSDESAVTTASSDELLSDESAVTAASSDELLSDESAVTAASSDELLSDESAVTNASSDELLSDETPVTTASSDELLSDDSLDASADELLSDVKINDDLDDSVPAQELKLDELKLDEIESESESDETLPDVEPADESSSSLDEELELENELRLDDVPVKIASQDTEDNEVDEENLTSIDDDEIPNVEDIYDEDKELDALMAGSSLVEGPRIVDRPTESHSTSFASTREEELLDDDNGSAYEMESDEELNEHEEEAMSHHEQHSQSQEPKQKLMSLRNLKLLNKEIEFSFENNAHFKVHLKDLKDNKPLNVELYNENIIIERTGLQVSVKVNDLEMTLPLVQMHKD